MPSKEITHVAKSIVYERGVIAIREDIVTFVDGNVETHDVMTVPTGVLVLPITEDKKIILTKEFRHNHGFTYAVPMGKIDEGENPKQAAERELKEEIGVVASKWTQISEHHNGPHEEGLNYYFVAQGLIYGESNHEDDEDIEQVITTFEKAFELMKLNQIVEVRTRGLIWAAYIYLKSGQTF